jgi:4-carboxymuconolactone decarboxylase
MSANENPGHEEAVKGLMTHNVDIIGSLLAMQIDNVEDSGLDPKTHALVRIAALVATDAAPASYMWQVGVALESGVTPEEILGVLIALAPTVGMARVVAAAPEIALALGMELEGLEF